jgi:acetyltransferase-like isoleucine patch superfamily enzyme
MRKVRNGIFTERNGNSQIVQLGEGSIIDENVTLGYPVNRGKDCLLVIGPRALIRSGTIIYRGSTIGCNLETGHNVIIREQNTIGDNLRVWANTIIDYGCVIGNNVKIHSNVYIPQFTTIESDVFIGPGVCLANDIHPGCPKAVECMIGPTIKKGAQIGINSSILPRVTIGEYAIIGAGSVVTTDVPAGSIAYGNPARVCNQIENLVCINGLIDKPYSHLIWRLKSANTFSGPEKAVSGDQK